MTTTQTPLTDARMSPPEAPVPWFARPATRLVGLAVAAIAISLLLATSSELSPTGLRDSVADLGWLAPVAFVLLYVVLTVALFPGAVTTSAAGLLFGAVGGTVVSVIGGTIGGTLAFLIGRRLGRRQVEQLGARRVATLDDFLSRRGFASVLTVRLIPLFPFNLVNYAAGVTALSTRDYVLGTALGVIPGSFAYAALGGSLEDPSSPAFLGAVALVLGLSAIGSIVARRMHRGNAEHLARADAPGQD